MNAQLSQINIYPIKSMQGINMTSALVETQGLARDRRLMLVNANGQFVTARKFPQLLAFRVTLLERGVIISAPSGQQLTVNFDVFVDEMEVSIWRDKLRLKCAAKEINKWLSTQLNQPVSLVMLTPECERYSEKLGQTLNLSDGHPLLLIGEASLQALNQRASEPSSMIQFRPNLVISGALPFAEDHWHRIKVGEVEFELVKPCERCIMTTVDLASYQARSSKEPLQTLARFRADPKGRLMFGENLIARNSGVIKLGDSIEVLSTRQAIKYSARP